MIKYAIFDLDGTLLDTRDGIISAAVQTMKLYNRKIPDITTLEGLIGPPMQNSFQTIYSLSDDEAMRMANTFREYYKNPDYLLKATPYDDIYNVLDILNKANIKVGIATYKREDYAKMLLKNKGFSEFTSFMYGSDFAGAKKKSDIIRICLSDMGCENAKEAVYIGDGKNDGIGASEVGISFIAVTYGFGFKSAKEAFEYKPIGIARNCKDIIDIIFEK